MERWKHVGTVTGLLVLLLLVYTLCHCRAESNKSQLSLTLARQLDVYTKLNYQVRQTPVRFDICCAIAELNCI